MNSEPNAEVPAHPAAEVPAGDAAVPARVAVQPIAAAPMTAARWVVMGLGVVALAALLLSGFLWQKLSSIQEQLARQSADTGIQSVEARATAKQAQELARGTAERAVWVGTRSTAIA